MKIGWTVKEVVGQAVVNPIIYVYDIINRNIETTNSSNLGELIQLCREHCPNRTLDILNIIERKIPRLKDDIDKYRILL